MAAETTTRIVFTNDGYYQLFWGGRGHVLKTGDQTPPLPLHEVKRLLNTGFFAATSEAWDVITKKGSDASQVTGMLAGRRVFLLGGGPSVKDHDLEKLKDEYVIAINHSYDFYPNANAVLFVDTLYAKLTRDRLKDYPGMVFASFRCQDELSGYHQKKNFFFFPQNNSRPGKSLAEGMYTGRLSGLCAINLALVMGASEIYLLGYDMNYRDGDHHWYGKAHENQENYSEDNFKRKIKYFDAYKPYAERIFNCSKTSALTQFQHKDFDQVLSQKKIQNVTTASHLDLRINRKTESSYPTFPVSNLDKLGKVNGMSKDKRVFVIGSGPSLKGFDLSRLDEEETIAVNHTLEHYHKAKHHLFGDPRVYDYVKPIYNNGFNGNVFASYHTSLGKFESENDHVYVFAKNWNRVTEQIEDGLYSDFNSGMEAVNLALVMGAKEIYLMGIDFSSDGEDYYFYGRPKWFTQELGAVDRLLSKRLQYWDKFTPYRDRIFNCSKISKVKQFEYRDIEEVLGV